MDFITPGQSVAGRPVDRCIPRPRAVEAAESGGGAALREFCSELEVLRIEHRALPEQESVYY